MSATLPCTPTERLAWLVGWLIECIAAKGHKNRVSGLLLLALATRARRICARFLAAAAARRGQARRQRPDPGWRLFEPRGGAGCTPPASPLPQRGSDRGAQHAGEGRAAPPGTGNAGG